MSETAYETFNEEQSELLIRTEARRIKSGINDARNSPENAGRRWPFELLQNAHDTGPYIGRESVQVSIILEQTSEGKKLLEVLVKISNRRKQPAGSAPAS